MTDGQPRDRGRYAAYPPTGDDITLSVTDWQSQVVTVMGRHFHLGEVSGGRLFHGSRVALPVGAILEPGHHRNFVQSAEDAVSFCSDPARAARWAQQTGGPGPVFVYEVEPDGEVTVCRAGLAEQGRSFVVHEARAARARIVAVRESAPRTNLS